MKVFIQESNRSNLHKESPCASHKPVLYFRAHSYCPLLSRIKLDRKIERYHYRHQFADSGIACFRDDTPLHI